MILHIDIPHSNSSMETNNYLEIKINNRLFKVINLYRTGYLYPKYKLLVVICIHSRYRTNCKNINYKHLSCLSE
jgi:hypothetical protein